MEVYKQTYHVQMVLDCFGMPKSTYYRWKIALKKMSETQDEVTKMIEDLCVRYHFIYGYRTIKRLLVREYGLLVNARKVYRIMITKGWLCRTRPKKSPKLGQPYYVTENKLNIEFKATKPMEKLVTDITYLYFEKCKLYLSSIMDLYNRKLSLIPFQTGKILTLCLIP